MHAAAADMELPVPPCRHEPQMERGNLGIREGSGVVGEVKRKGELETVERKVQACVQIAGERCALRVVGIIGQTKTCPYCATDGKRIGGLDLVYAVTYAALTVSNTNPQYKQ